MGQRSDKIRLDQRLDKIQANWDKIKIKYIIYNTLSYKYNGFSSLILMSLHWCCLFGLHQNWWSVVGKC